MGKVGDKALWWGIAILIMGVRLTVAPRLTNIPTPEGSFEAFAHLIVGFMIIVRWYDPTEVLGPSRLGIIYMTTSKGTSSLGK